MYTSHSHTFCFSFIKANRLSSDVDILGFPFKKGEVAPMSKHNKTENDTITFPAVQYSIENSQKFEESYPRANDKNASFWIKLFQAALKRVDLSKSNLKILLHFLSALPIQFLL